MMSCNIMIILVSGSVGSGKTTIADELGIRADFDIVHLNDLAEKYKIEYNKKLETFDFDIDALLDDIESKIKKWRESGKKVIIESHFSHFINHDLVDFLFVINRDLKDLKKEYRKRDYNLEKIRDNLEVESFNLCYYEALENGFEEEDKVLCVQNEGDLDVIVSDIYDMIKKVEKKGNKALFEV